MNTEKLASYKDFPFSRYKNTSDITWKNEMEKAINKIRAAQSQMEIEQLSLKFD